jgi:hypothetical protein
MSDETTPPVEPDSGATPPADSETGTAKACSLCGEPAPKENRAFVNRKIVCLACRDKIEEELQAEQAGAVRMVPAIAGAVAGALIGAVLWAVIVVVTDYEVGFVALAVGWLAGMGAVVGAGGKKGRPLQVVAALSSVLGLVLGKYFTFAHFLKEYVADGDEMSYFDSRIIDYFVDHPEEMFSGFDILWLVLAIGVAFKVPASTKVSMSRRRRG